MKLPFCMLKLIICQEAHMALSNTFSLKNISWRGVWVAQSVKWPTLDFGLCHDLRVLESSPEGGSTLSRESA